jgi:probable addiction module antidote protein
MTKYAHFDAADYLDDEETIAEYLTAALEDPDPDVFLTAVRDVARAKGMTQLAKDAGLAARAFTRLSHRAPSHATTPCSSFCMLSASSFLLRLLTHEFRTPNATEPGTATSCACGSLASLGRA